MSITGTAIPSSVQVRKEMAVPGADAVLCSRYSILPFVQQVLLTGVLQNGHSAYILQGNRFHDFLEEWI
jgi:hypothetical protein